jgi:plastocyanin
MPRVLLSLLLVVASPLTAVSGTITGRVVFRGEIPNLPPIAVSKDHHVCGEQVPQEALIVSATNRGVRNTVVFLEGVTPVEGGPPPGEVALENRACRFVPHVVAVRVGTELAIGNADPVLHNLRAWSSPERRAFLNVVQPTQGQVSRRPIRRPGFLALQCDTHVHMSGYLLAFDHPYFAVTDANGAFRIAEVPPGTYRITAWHEGWTVVKREPESRLVYEPPHLLTREVTVPQAGEVRLQFELTGRQ